ncbi:MAG: LemA family protein [Candidatus Micrarchaeota archaeon]|nr:LemA family protein [Candidatus Micrarchaeota archaeon]
MSSSGDGMVLLGLGALSGIYSYYMGIKLFSLLKKIENTPTCKVIAAYPGTVELQGKAKRMGELFTSPLEKKPCVYYETVVKKWIGSGKHRKCELVDRKTSKTPFFLEDDTGQIMIDPSWITLEGNSGIKIDRNASIDEMPSLRKDTGLVDTVKWMLFLKNREKIDPQTAPLTEEEKKSDVAAFIAENYPSLRGYEDTIDVSETYIMEGDPIYVIGTAQMVDDQKGHHLIIRKSGNNPYYICDGTEKEAKQTIGTDTYLSLIGGPILFFICSVLLATIYFKVDALLAASAAGALVGLAYLYLVAIMLLGIYNGMVLLKTQIEMAKANLQALYERRQVLIPQLVAVVEEAARHEKKLQGAIAELRARAIQDEKSIFAIGEKYPLLKANENFLALQKELSKTESWIAGGRAFLVDSITLYNTKIQSFPHYLIAKIAGFKPAAMETG